MEEKLQKAYQAGKNAYVREKEHGRDFKSNVDAVNDARDILNIDYFILSGEDLKECDKRLAKYWATERFFGASTWEEAGNYSDEEVAMAQKGYKETEQRDTAIQ